ncbi:hypothetical protein TNCV_3396341 [Trichonephila clavipes]|nr:hypothetical protein TNCV_3396341 [Trichonephila clavipes]
MKILQDINPPLLQMKAFSKIETALAKRRIIVDAIATAVNISQDCAHQIVYDVLVFHKICGGWVSRKLTTEDSLIPPYISDGSSFVCDA